MISLVNALVLVPLVLLCSDVSAQRYLRSSAPLSDINIDVKAEDNSRHGHGGSEEAERLKRQAPTRLDDINIKVDAVDNSHHGTGAGHDGGEEAQRLKRHEPLSVINIGVNATDNSKQGSGHLIPRGPGTVVPSNPTGSDGNAEPISEGVGNDGPAIGQGAVQTESQRLKRQAERLDDINIDVNAVDNSHHGAGGHAGGEEAERLKRQAPLNAINIGVNATDNSKHGDGHGQKSGGHQPSGPVEQPEPRASAGDEAERLKRQAPLNAINIGVNATDNSKHGGGRKGGHPVPRGPGPVKPSKPTGQSGSEEGPGGSSETEGPDGHDGAGHDGACNGSNNNNNNNNNNNGNSNNNNNNNNNCKGGNNNNNNNNRLKRHVLTRLDDINVKVDAVDNSRHGAAAGGRGGTVGGQEGPEGEDAGRLARRG